MELTKDTLISVKNKFDGTVGYEVPDLKVYRNFYPNETKMISYDELEKSSYTPGGMVILKEYLEVQNREAISKLLNTNPEPEYFYSKEDIVNIMRTGSLDQFLDCLDFAPEGIRDTIKDLAVELPLNDVQKREAIKEKLGFDVDMAISVRNTKFDGGAADTSTTPTKVERRTSTTPTATGRRYKPN